MINEKQNYYETDVGHFSFDKHKLSNNRPQKMNE